MLKGLKHKEAAIIDTSALRVNTLTIIGLITLDVYNDINDFIMVIMCLAAVRYTAKPSAAELVVSYFCQLKLEMLTRFPALTE